MDKNDTGRAERFGISNLRGRGSAMRELSKEFVMWQE